MCFIPLVSLVGLWSVIAAFPGHTYLLFVGPHPKATPRPKVIDHSVLEKTLKRCTVCTHGGHLGHVIRTI